MGRFYSKPDPSSPSFVAVGDRITADTILRDALREADRINAAKAAGASH